jgi:hypothetical protein
MKKIDEELIFKEACIKWTDKLGLYDWDRGYLYDTPEGSNGHVLLNPNSRKATICLCKNREEFVKIDNVAKHEALEILMADIGFLLKRYYSEELIDDEIHKIINRLMVAL